MKASELIMMDSSHQGIRNIADRLRPVPIPDSEIVWPGREYPISPSALKTFRGSVPRYAGIYIYKTIPRTESTEGMDLGTLTHAIVWEPEKIHDGFLLAPDCDRRTKAGKDAWSEIEDRATSEKKTIVTEDQVCSAIRMADAIWSHRPARELIERPGKPEAYLEVTDMVGFEPLKLQRRFDVLFDEGGEIELKTTKFGVGADEFGKTGANLEYHYAMCFGRHVAEIARPDIRHDQQWFVAVQSVEPYEVAVYQFHESSDEYRYGMRAVREDLAEIADRLQRNDWSSRTSEPSLYKHPGWWANQQKYRGGRNGR